MLPNILKIDSTHQDENDEMDAMSLYSRRKCYVNVMVFLTLFSVKIDINIITSRYTFGNLTT